MPAFAAPSTWGFGQSVDSYGFAPGESMMLTPLPLTLFFRAARLELLLSCGVRSAEKQKTLAAAPR